MKTGFFFVADHLLIGQLCTNPKRDKSLLSCLKVTHVQRARSEMRRCTIHALYQSKLWQQGHCQHPQNANPDGSTLEGRSQGEKIKFPAMVMVFGVVSSEGHIMPPHIFEVGLKVNTKVYLDMLKSVVIPWWNQVAGGRSWVWQQDPSPAHKSKETQAWLQKECYDFIPFSYWTLSSPDLNLLDYFVWSYVENITNMTPHNTKASLITAIRRVFAELPPTHLEKACSHFRIRIEAVIEAEGGYIKQMPVPLHNQVTWIDFFNKSFKIKL